jgi:HAD superfamily 5'-nucleotidase-like hydrolase
VTAADRRRGIFANRTLNLRSITTIGYDLDYTLVHYKPEEWEGSAYDYARDRLAERGWPVENLAFDPNMVIQGLTIDLELGNIVKATRFGYVIRAAHGTRMLDHRDVRRTYAGTPVELASPRFVFLNTLFSLSEAVLFAQVVDLADDGRIGEVAGYEDLYRIISDALEETHIDGTVKSQVLADPERFIVPDPDVVDTIRDQRDAGKELMLITNSEWAYASKIMELAVGTYLDPGESWRDLFDAVIVSADKPAFFEEDRTLFEVVDEEQSTLRPHFGPIERKAVYYGGSALRVEESLGRSGSQILYIGDHLFGDIHISKAALRWRTGLVIRELEPEVDAIEAFRDTGRRIATLMQEKKHLEHVAAIARTDRLHIERDGGDASEINDVIRQHTDAIAELDSQIGPMASAGSELSNDRWGLLMRAGLDKSLFARQVERHADVYTSRVANFGTATPYAMLRSIRSDLPHDV